MSDILGQAIKGRIEDLEAENKRLREALENILQDDHVQNWRTKPGNIARAALEDNG